MFLLRAEWNNPDNCGAPEGWSAIVGCQKGYVNVFGKIKHDEMTKDVLRWSRGCNRVF